MTCCGVTRNINQKTKAMANKRNTYIVRFIAMALLVMATLSSCERKPLYLQATGQVDVEVGVYDIELQYIWGTEWVTEWQYEWDEAEYGAIGYTKPHGVRATIYGLDNEMHRDNFFTQNFGADGGRVSLLAGNWYDLLFYNNGTNYILFNTDESHSFYTATTRTSMRSNYSSDDTRAYVDMNQPEELFGCFMEKNEISLNPDDYEIEYDEDGTTIYVYKLNATLRPHTMIYLVQVIMLNNLNEKGERIVKGAKGLTLSGLASGTDLFTRLNNTERISLTTDDIKPLQTDRNLKLPDGTIEMGDIMATRMLTWGLPGIDPLAARSRNGDVEADSCYVGVGLTLSNNAVFTVQGNITEKIRKRPSGGVITLVIDAAKLPEPPEPGGESGGGFDASVNDWDNEINADIII